MSLVDLSSALEEIVDLESYLLNLGIMALSINTIAKQQQQALNIGILNDDETENSRTIIYEVQRLLTVMDDQLRLVGLRSPVEWSELMKKVAGKLPKKPHGQSSDQGKRSRKASNIGSENKTSIPPKPTQISTS